MGSHLVFFPASSRSSKCNCSSTGTSNQSQIPARPTMTNTTIYYPPLYCRNWELNAYQCTNPDSNSYGPTMVKSYHYITITAAEAWRGLAPGVCIRLSLFVCVCVVWPVPTSFHSNMATKETHIHSSATSPSASIPSPSFFIPTNGEAAGGYDVCCVTRGHRSLSSCIFFSQLHSSVQTVSYTYRRWFSVSKPGRYLTCSHKM